jgi:hypothetical protein
MMITMIKTWSNNEGFVSVFLSVSENNLVLIRMVRGNSNTEIDFGPFLNLSSDICRFGLIRGETVMGGRNILLRDNEFTLFRNNSHFVMVSLRLNLHLFSNSGSISSTYI